MRGLIYVSTNATPFFGVPMSFTVVGLGRTGPLPNATWIFLAVAISLGVRSAPDTVRALCLRHRRQHRRRGGDGHRCASGETGCLRAGRRERRRVRDHPHRSDGQRTTPGGAQLRTGGDHRRHRRRRLTRWWPGWDGRHDRRHISARSGLERAQPLRGLRVLATGRHRNHPGSRRRRG